MTTLKLQTVMLQVRQYFQPLVVSVANQSTHIIDITLSDPCTDESVTLEGIPITSTMTLLELFRFIQLIEDRAKRIRPSLFDAHVVNKLK